MKNDDWTFSAGGAPKRVQEASSADTSVPVPPPPIASPPPPALPQLPQQIIYARPTPIGHPTNGMATASLVLGIIGMLLPILSILAVIFGGIGISKANQGAPGKGLAIAGLVLGILGTLVLLAAIGQST